MALTDTPIKEIDFQRQLVGPAGIATILGWEHVHFRPAMTKHGWRTAGSGELAAGWLDLTLVRARDRRLIFAELKADGAHLRPAQLEVMKRLHALADEPPWDVATGRSSLAAWWSGYRPDDRGRAELLVPVRVEAFTWRPADLPVIAEILR